MNLILKRHFFGDEDEKKLAIFLYQVSGNVTIFSKHDKLKIMILFIDINWILKV
jgi:hypothetical protein